MLTSGKVIGFVPTKDSTRARSFYEGKLGFQFVSDDMFALVMRAGETMIRIAKANDFTPAPYTVLGWEVANIEEVVAWLQKRGVAFEKYPFVQDKELGIRSEGQRFHSGSVHRARLGSCEYRGSRCLASEARGRL